MNLNIINLEPTDWNRADWQYAYAEYCKANMFGKKTKREYFDFVMNNHNRLKTVRNPLSEELRSKWSNGFKNASVWAKKRKCNMNGETLENRHPEINLEELQNDVREIQWQMMNQKTEKPV